MEIVRLICCTISFLTVFLAGIYILNKLMNHFFERSKEEIRFGILEKQNTQIDKLKKDKESIKLIETQLKKINERLEKLDPVKQKEKQEADIKFIIEKMKSNKKINIEKYLDILIELNKNKEPTDV